MTEIHVEPLSEKVSADSTTKAKLAATGGVVGALLASTCCIIPLLLFSLGISGAWIGQLTALEPYRPLFIAMTIGFLGYGYWLVYQKLKTACAEGEACARPLPKTLVKAGLWFASILVILAFAWPAIVPLILP